MATKKMAAAATQDTIMLSTGDLNGRNVAGEIVNSPYFVQLNTANASIEIVDSLTGTLLGSVRTVSTKVLALAKADLATAPYTALPIGTTLSVVDYAGTGTGCTMQKTTDANGTFADWMIIASDAKADTGGIGTNPA